MADHDTSNGAPRTSAAATANDEDADMQADADEQGGEEAEEGTVKASMSIDQALREVESLLNRLSIFRQGKVQLEAAAALEPFATFEPMLAVMDFTLIQSAFFVAKDAVASVLQSEQQKGGGTTSTAGDEAVLKVTLQICTNCCLSDDDQTNRRVLLGVGITTLCASILQSPRLQTSVPCVYAVLDAISTLCTNSSALRQGFAPCLGRILDAMKANRAQLDVLFGGCCALTTLTLADGANANALLAAGGFSVLLEVYKFAARKAASQTWQKKPSAPGTATEDADDEETAELLKSILHWGKAGLTNLVRAAAEGSVEEALGKAQYGRYGDLLAVDELKWELTNQLRRRRGGTPAAGGGNVAGK